MNVKKLGQVFTPVKTVEQMLKLKKHRGSTLEPSAGNGAFLSKLDNKAIGIELDKRIIKDKRVISSDFFGYSIKNKFDTIIGNPPYVRYQDILDGTKQKLNKNLFDKRTNLYLFFIEKSIRHLRKGGELIFITPRDFLKTTSAGKLNEILYREGSFTDFFELGDSKIFENHTPNCAIWRWEKGRADKKLSCGKVFFCSSGQIWFGYEASEKSLSYYFDVKVGAVSGADSIFSNSKFSNIEMVCSRTYKTGEKRKMIYNKKCKYLEQFKDRLLSRRIKSFNGKNWWQWGRGYCDKEGERIYVNCKTRNKKPFFVSDVTAYDGSVLALFPKNQINLNKAVKKLNSVEWEKLGFVCDGRFIFSQKSLQNAPVGSLL